MELAYQSNVTNNSSTSLASFYGTTQANKVNQNQVFYDDNSFYRPGSNALNCSRNDNLFEKKKEVHDTEEGPEWIKELNKLVQSTMEGITLNK